MYYCCANLCAPVRKWPGACDRPRPLLQLIVRAQVKKKRLLRATESSSGDVAQASPVSTTPGPSQTRKRMRRSVTWKKKRKKEAEECWTPLYV